MVTASYGSKNTRPIVDDLPAQDPRKRFKAEGSVPSKPHLKGSEDSKTKDTPTMKKGYPCVTERTHALTRRPTLRIALIAHDSRKDELIAFARMNFQTLCKAEITATANTGQRLAELGLACLTVNSGPAGGDIEIGCQVVRGELDAVVFLQDLQVKHIHAADIASLIRVCGYHGVPMAGTIQSAHRLLTQMAVSQALPRDALTQTTTHRVCANPHPVARQDRPKTVVF